MGDISEVCPVNGIYYNEYNNKKTVEVISMFQLPKEPQSPITIVLNSCRLWKNNVRKLLLLAFISVVFGTFPSFVVQEFNIAHPVLAAHHLQSFILDNFVSFSLFIVVTFYLFATLLYRTHMLINDLEGGIGKALWVALKRIPYLVIALVLYAIVVSAGMALLVIPGIGLMILLSMYFVLIVVDNKTPITAFKESWLLVTEEWVHTFITLLLILAILFVFVIPVDWFAEELWTITHPSGGNIWIGHHLLRMAIGLLFYPFFCSALLVLLNDLKVRAGLRAEPVPIGSSQ